MKASELRIGNWLHRLDGSLFQVNEDDFKILAHGLPDNLHPKPIPLTEEWLLKFGFQWDVFYQKYTNGTICVDWRDKIVGVSWCKTSKVDILRYEYPKHVHQLQNLYFALTGEELTVNEK